MGKILNIVNKLHKSTKRNYLERMIDEKVICMKKAREFEREFWDGEKRYGYGGYYYDGRWQPVAAALIKEYNLNNQSKILDVGCGKGFLLFEIKKLLPDIVVVGFDVSHYALENAKEEIKKNLFIYDAAKRQPFLDKEFDLVFSLATLHNLKIYDLKTAVQEIERVGKNKYVMVEAYDTEEQLFNLQCWALTCEGFFRTDEWVWIFNEFGYTGDYEFIYFD